MRFINFIIQTPLSVVYFAFLILVVSCNQSGTNVNDTSDECTNSKAIQLYNTYCASCHSADFGGGNSQSLIDGVWQFGNGFGYVSRNIKFGIPHLGMPSFENTLSEEEIKTLVDFLYEEESKAGATKPDPPAELESADYE